MLVNLKIPILKAFIYEPDLSFLTRLFLENLSEAPLAVRPDKLRDPYWDTDVSNKLSFDTIVFHKHQLED